MLKFIILSLIFSSVCLLAYQIIPLISKRLQRIQRKKVVQAERQLEDMFVLMRQEKLFLYYTVSPLILGSASFLLFHKVSLVLLAGVIGIILPTFIIKNIQTLRKQKFQRQLPDALMLLSSSLKAGLSFLQAVEVLVEEMPAPISQEFSLILRENKMSVPLEESLERLNKKMEIEELELVINSILVSRETGGDLTKVFSRLSTTIRDNTKLKENIKTLTIQGRIQGIIMSVLPFVFIGWILTFNRRHFDIMLNNETGRMLLIVAVILQIVGLILICKFSRLRM